MKITGTQEEFDVVLRALLKYRHVLRNANDKGVASDIAIMHEWIEENTPEQVQRIYDELEFCVEVK